LCRADGVGENAKHDLRRLELRTPPGDPIDAWLREVVTEDVSEAQVIAGRQGIEPGVSRTVAQDERGVRQFLAVDDDPALADLRLTTSWPSLTSVNSMFRTLVSPE